MWEWSLVEQLGQELNPDYQPKPISGLGGWLILIHVGLYISLLMSLNQFSRELIPFIGSEEWGALTSKYSEYYHPLWAPGIILETVYHVVFILFTIFILVNFYSKRRAFIFLMIIYFSLNLLFYIIDSIIVYQIPILREYDDGNSLKLTVRQAISCAIWIPYFLKSKRVKNTFIR